MPGALEGVRVLDCTQVIAGPLAGALLSEMGAEVVKVEPLEGEPWRLQAEIIPKESRNFTVQNPGRFGLTIDLKRPFATGLGRRPAYQLPAGRGRRAGRYDSGTTTPPDSGTSPGQRSWKCVSVSPFATKPRRR